MNCQIHGSEFRHGKWGDYCPAQIGLSNNGKPLYCKEKPQLSSSSNDATSNHRQTEFTKSESINLTVSRQEAVRLVAVMVSAGIIKDREDVESAIEYFSNNNLAWFQVNNL